MPRQGLTGAPFPVRRVAFLTSLRAAAEIVVVLVGIGPVFRIPPLPARLEQITPIPPRRIAS